MRIFENSRLEESILSADLPPVSNGWRAGSTVRPAGDPTQQYNRDQASVSRTVPGSKFDELYQQALRNTESILSDSGNPPDDGHVTLRNLYSPVRSVDCVPSDNETPAVKPGLPSVISLDRSLASAKPGQNGHISSNNDKPHHSAGQHLSVTGTLGKPQDVNSSVDSRRVNETEASAEFTSVDDNIEEIILDS